MKVLCAEPKPRLLAGVGLYYGEEIHGVPPVLLQMVSRTPVLYEVNIFVTNRFVPIPEVLEAERLLVEQLGVSGFYHVIARCGRMPHIMHQTRRKAGGPACNGTAAARQALLQTSDCGQGPRVGSP